MRKMGVVGVRVRVSDPDHDVLVVLNESDGELSLPIVIGPHEGIAIATAQAGVATSRPGPHELMLTALAATGVVLDRVTISELREGTFIAQLLLTNGRTVDSRASDAITLALRAKVDVWCAEDVLAQAAMVLDLDGEDDDEQHVSISGTGKADEAVAQFREFLEQVDPSDFEGPDEHPLT